jgi:glycosyltransferase involved in cell wall biosynthesis
MTSSRSESACLATPESPLRVCYVVSYFHPLESGAERQALEQGTELVRQGHEVHVVTRWAQGLARDEVVQGIHVHRWIKVSTRGPLFGVSFVAGVVKALRRLRRQIDLVHTHQALWEAVATGLARPFLGGIPTLVQPASSGYYGEAEELQRTRGSRWLRRLILNNSAFAAISNDIERQWRALGVPDGKMARTASGVDTCRFHPGPSACEATLPPRPRVVFMGRLHPQKNLGVLLDAWPIVRRTLPAHLLLVGEGAERASISERIENVGLTESIHLLGETGQPAEVLRAADVFVLPSVAEGMSNALLEAMATGLPCLASKIGGNEDLIDEGVSGHLLSPHEPNAWAEAIVGVLSDPARAATLGRAALKSVESRYALPAVVSQYVALYRRLIQASRRRESDGMPS